MTIKFIQVNFICIIFLVTGKLSFAAELLTNGGFESKDSQDGWTIQTSWKNQKDSWHTIQKPSGAHTGNRYQYLGAKRNRISTANNVDSTLYQTVTVPHDSISATLSYHLKISTKESPHQTADQMFVEIRSSNGERLSTLNDYSNLDAQQFSTWTQQAANLTRYAGQTIQIVFHGTTNSTIKTVFRIDDVSLQINGGISTQIEEFLNLTGSRTTNKFELSPVKNNGRVTSTTVVAPTQPSWAGLTSDLINQVANKVIPDRGAYLSFTTLFVTQYARSQLKTETILSEAIEAYQKSDYRPAKRKFTLLADKGNAVAQFNLGAMNELGQGGRQNYRKAIQLYRQAGTQGYAKAQRKLGLIYANGKGVQQDYNNAILWFYKAADQNDPIAQFNLGIMYALGQGVAKNDHESALWFIKAAEQNNDMAQFNLGVIFTEGLGVVQDYSGAIQWYQKSADQGNASAQYNLAQIYREGEIIPQDYSLALPLLQKSADQGNDLAQLELGLMYTNGEGITQNFVQAYKWFSLAENSSSDNKAEEQKSTIAAQMSPTEIKAAEQLARNWLLKLAKE